MGVPKFYRWISERYPCLSQIVRQCQIPEFDNFYLDMNGIIHTCSHPNDDDPHFRISEEKIFEDILHYIEFLFQMIKPRKVFFMAVDGVAPRAKMNQQRARRFRTAKDVEAQEKKAKEKGEVLPSEERFDSNCITPGTVFMARLQEQLKYFVVMKVSNDKAWRDVKVYLSGHETPGEGEHKIMDFIRYERSQPGYDPNTRHCLYGLDADLIMLGLSTHEPHLAVLREEVVFSWKHPKKARVIPEHTTFHLLHLSLMREYLDFEFSALKETVPFSYNLDNVIDDWILMGFLVGNDFIPNLPYLHIQKDALQILYKAYIEVLPTLDGYINEGGVLSLERFEKYLQHLSKYDYEKFNDTYADLKYWEAKTGRKMGNEGEEIDKGKKYELEDSLDMFSLDEDEEEDEDEDELFELEFKQHKCDYYIKKLEYEIVTPEVLKEQADCYVRAIQWNLHYYYNGVMSWSWFYPHHYAPYVSDIKGFNNLDLNFDKGKPFLPFQQLLSVLPEACKKLLPESYQALMTDPESPLKSFYPNDFKTDLNGKTQEWEAVVLLPFINEKLLVDATLALESSLTAEERKRNSHGPHLLYTYTEENLGTYKSSLPGHFADIENHARCKEIDENHFRLPIEKIKKGLLENTKVGVYFSGFPTFKHLKFTVELKNEEVRVFQRTSTGANMMITLEDTSEKDVQLVSLLVGQTMFVHWPHLVEAQVVEVTDGKQRFFLRTSKEPKDTVIQSSSLNDVEKDIWKKETHSIVRHHYQRYGIHTGKIEIMIRAKTLTGRKYLCTADGKVVLNKQWSLGFENFALQTVVKDIDVHLSPLKEPETVEELYPVGTCCFMLGHPYYGAMGEVIECSLQENKGRLRVKLHIPEEPSLAHVMRNEKSISLRNYVPGYLAARQLGISSFLFSRLVGTCLVQTTSPESMVVNRVNVGLKIKFNRRGEETPGYSRRLEDSTWLYSEKTIRVMEDYLKEFPEFFDKLVTANDLYMLHLSDLFPDEKEGKEILKKITNWLKAQPCTDVERQSCNAKILDDSIVKAIEATVDHSKMIPSRFGNKYVRILVNPNLLFCPSDIYGTSPPDPRTRYELYDRVISVQASHSVPLGYRGTVIGIEEGEQAADDMYIVVFDNEFPGGLSLHCSESRGYKMRPFDLINISYGQRTAPDKQYASSKEQSGIKRFHGNSYAEEKEGQQENDSLGELDRSHNFITPKISPVAGPSKIASKMSYQDAISAENTPNKSGKMKFETVWRGLQQTYPPQEREPNEAVPAYSKQVSVEELFQGAMNAKVSPTPSSQKENQSQNAVPSDQHNSSSFEELCNISLRIWGKPPPCQELTTGPMGLCQAEIYLPNGKTFFSVASPSKKEAKESAAEQALAFLKAVFYDEEKQQLLQIRDERPDTHHLQRFASMVRPVFPVPEFQYLYPTNYSVPPAFPTPSLRNDTFVLRHPPPPRAAFIPKSFVESNRERTSNIDSSKISSSSITDHPKVVTNSVSQVEEFVLKTSGSKKQELDVENKKKHIKQKNLKTENSKTQSQNAFVPMQPNKSGKMKFETVWKGLQQTYPPQEREPNEAAPAYSKQVSVEELFQGAVNASHTPSSQKENQSQNAMQADQHKSSSYEELCNVSLRIWGKYPQCQETTPGPMMQGLLQAEIYLPNGKKFSSLSSPNRKEAKESAAEQALTYLKAVFYDEEKQIWQIEQHKEQDIHPQSASSFATDHAKGVTDLVSQTNECLLNTSGSSKQECDVRNKKEHKQNHRTGSSKMLSENMFVPMQVTKKQVAIGRSMESKQPSSQKERVTSERSTKEPHVKNLGNTEGTRPNRKQKKQQQKSRLAIKFDSCNS